MSFELTPYPTYKPSGIDWLGNIPSHWNIFPGRASYEEKPQRKNVGLQETTVLSLSYGEIVIKPPESLHGLVPESFETYQIVEPLDIIVRPTDLQNDWNSLRFGLSPHTGIITSAYMCLATSKDMTSEYGYLLYHAYDLKKVFYGLGSGLRQNLSWKDFKYLPSLVPPLDEQAAIVRYLDGADERIQRAISAKERLIDLLTEQRQAVIHQAVTRGLDSNVRLKDSGVEWLGEVPEHWEVRRLGYLATKFGSGITPRGGATVYQETGIPFLRSQNIHFDGLRIEDVAYISERLHNELIVSHVQPGDVLRNITGASIGRVCSVPMDFTEANVNQHVCIIRPRKEYILSNFLSAYMSTPIIQGEIYTQQSGASREGLTLQSIRSFSIPVPPLSEQVAIACQLDKATADIDATIANAQRQIDLLRECRTRLIADVVTGQVDVRGAVEDEVELPVS